jgi:hypothetical protein
LTIMTNSRSGEGISARYVGPRTDVKPADLPFLPKRFQCAICYGTDWQHETGLADLNTSLLKVREGVFKALDCRSVLGNSTGHHRSAIRRG